MPAQPAGVSGRSSPGDNGRDEAVTIQAHGLPAVGKNNCRAFCRRENGILATLTDFWEYITIF